VGNLRKVSSLRRVFRYSLREESGYSGYCARRGVPPLFKKRNDSRCMEIVTIIKGGKSGREMETSCNTMWECLTSMIIVKIPSEVSKHLVT